MLSQLPSEYTILFATVVFALGVSLILMHTTPPSSKDISLNRVAVFGIGLIASLVIGFQSLFSFLDLLSATTLDLTLSQMAQLFREVTAQSNVLPIVWATEISAMYAGYCLLTHIIFNIRQPSGWLLCARLALFPLFVYLALTFTRMAIWHELDLQTSTVVLVPPIALCVAGLVLAIRASRRITLSGQLKDKNKAFRRWMLLCALPFGEPMLSNALQFLAPIGVVWWLIGSRDRDRVRIEHMVNSINSRGAHHELAINLISGTSIAYLVMFGLFLSPTPPLTATFSPTGLSLLPVQLVFVLLLLVLVSKRPKTSWAYLSAALLLDIVVRICLTLELFPRNLGANDLRAIFHTIMPLSLGASLVVVGSFLQLLFYQLLWFFRFSNRDLSWSPDRGSRLLKTLSIKALSFDLLCLAFIVLTLTIIFNSSTTFLQASLSEKLPPPWQENNVTENGKEWTIDSMRRHFMEVQPEVESKVLSPFRLTFNAITILFALLILGSGCFLGLGGRPGIQKRLVDEFGEYYSGAIWKFCESDLRFQRTLCWNSIVWPVLYLLAAASIVSCLYLNYESQIRMPDEWFTWRAALTSEP